MERLLGVSHRGKPLSCFRGIGIAIGDRERNKQNPPSPPEKIADFSFSVIEILAAVQFGSAKQKESFRINRLHLSPSARRVGIRRQFERFSSRLR